MLGWGASRIGRARALRVLMLQPRAIRRETIPWAAGTRTPSGLHRFLPPELTSYEDPQPREHTSSRERKANLRPGSAKRLPP